MNNRTANFATPLLTYVLIAACVGGFLLQNTDPERWIIAGALWPLGDYFEPWQVITYAFLHGDSMHLMFNMLGVFKNFRRRLAQLEHFFPDESGLFRQRIDLQG